MSLTLLLFRLLRVVVQRSDLVMTIGMGELLWSCHPLSSWGNHLGIVVGWLTKLTKVRLLVMILHWHLIVWLRLRLCLRLWLRLGLWLRLWLGLLKDWSWLFKLLRFENRLERRMELSFRLHLL